MAGTPRNARRSEYTNIGSETENTTGSAGPWKRWSDTYIVWRTKIKKTVQKPKRVLTERNGYESSTVAITLTT